MLRAAPVADALGDVVYDQCWIAAGDTFDSIKEDPSPLSGCNAILLFPFSAHWRISVSNVFQYSHPLWYYIYYARVPQQTPRLNTLELPIYELSPAQKHLIHLQ